MEACYFRSDIKAIRMPPPITESTKVAPMEKADHHIASGKFVLTLLIMCTNANPADAIAEMSARLRNHRRPFKSFAG